MKTENWASRHWVIPVTAVAVFAAGVGSAWAVGATRPAIAMAPVHAVPLNWVATTEGIVTAKGKVGQVYDDRFQLSDGSGQMLVQAGHRFGLMPLVATGDTVTVQGRFDDGLFRAAYLVDAKGTVVALRGHGHGWHRQGERDHRFGPPPPPAPDAPAAPAPRP